MNKGIHGLVIASSSTPVTVIAAYLRARRMPHDELAFILDFDQETMLDLVHGVELMDNTYRWVEDVTGILWEVLERREVKVQWGFEIDCDGTAELLSDAEVEALRRYLARGECRGEEVFVQ